MDIEFFRFSKKFEGIDLNFSEYDGLHFSFSSAVSRNVMGHGGGEGELFSLWFGVFVVSGNYSTFSPVLRSNIGERPKKQ